MATSPQWPPLYNDRLSTIATSPQHHLSTPTICLGRQSIHSLLFQPLYNGHLSTTATSLEWPPLHNGHLSTMVIFLADSPYIHSCFNLSTMATSLQWSPLHYGHLSTMATSLQRPPRHYDHLSTTTTSPQRPPLFNGHLSTMATSPQRPPFTTALFLVHSPYIHYIVSTSLQRLQRPLSSVPNVAVVERFNCNLTSSIANEDV